nr:MAG: hypothetical protein DIU64_10665 [Caldicoprobacter oshimai]
MKKVKISDSELKIMQVLWDNNPIFSSDIVKALADTGWDPKTIHTFLRRLVSKGIVKATKKGTFYEYTPLISRDEYVIKESKSFLNKIFNGSLSNMVYKFVNEGELSADEYQRLKDLLETIADHFLATNSDKNSSITKKQSKSDSHKNNASQFDFANFAGEE